MPDLLTDHKSAVYLREYLPKGSTCYTVLRHVSRSGMLRRISPIAIDIERAPGSQTAMQPTIRHLDYLAADVLGRKGANGEGVKCTGAGMDMGFELVYSLAQALYGDGYALSQRWI